MRQDNKSIVTLLELQIRAIDSDMAAYSMMKGNDTIYYHAFCDALDKMIVTYTDYVSEKVGLKNGELIWFMADNAMGEAERSFKKNGTKIKRAAQFFEGDSI